MIAATVCSGIGAPEVAMPHWQWSLASEIEAAPRAIMSYRHGAEDARRTRQGGGPALWGDFTAIRVRFLRRLGVTLPQWLVAGTPCQSFSVAGLRGGMADARGNLTMEFLRLVHALRRAGSLRGFLWENVPGILSHADNPFGCFLAGIVGSDTPIVSPLKRGRWPSAGMVDGPFGKAAWRVSDAQYFGLAQRRARVILVASFVDGIDPAAILFERAGLHGDHPPRREPGQAAPTIPSRSTGGGGLGTDFDCDGGLIPHVAEIAATLPAGGNQTGGARQPGMGAETAATMLVSATVSSKWAKGSGGPSGGPSGDECQNLVAVPLAFNSREDCCSSEEVFGSLGSSSPQAAAVAFAIQAGALRENVKSGPDGAGFKEDVAYTLEARSEVQSVAFDMRGREGGAQFEGPHDTANIRAASGGSSRSYVASTGVRRLMPVECERLQGFPDHFTAIPYRTRTVDADEAELAAIEGRSVWQDGDRLVTDCMADGPRYKALGNSMPVNVIRHYLQRVEMQAA